MGAKAVGAAAAVGVGIGVGSLLSQLSEQDGGGSRSDSGVETRLDFTDSPIRAASSNSGTIGDGVAESAAGTTVDGGEGHIMDMDDDWLSLSPEPSGFRAFTAAAGRAQRKQGGNRTIGRDLGRLLEKANYQAVNLHVETITSRQLGMRTFLDITLGFKRLLLSGEELDQASAILADAEVLINDPKAWALVGVFLATGQA